MCVMLAVGFLYLACLGVNSTEIFNQRNRSTLALDFATSLSLLVDILGNGWRVLWGDVSPAGSSLHFAGSSDCSFNPWVSSSGGGGD